MILLSFLLAAATPSDAAVAARVQRVLRAQPVIDGHNDLPWELRDKYGSRIEAVNLHKSTALLAHPLQTDIPRLRASHYGAQFWSVWIPPTTPGPQAVEMTIEQIDLVHRMVAAYPDVFVMARTAADVRAAEKRGKIASLIGVEGGEQIDGRLSVLRQYRALGASYMTLTHTLTTDWADSATDVPKHHGLTPFGLAVIAEMNQIGMMVDLSHVSPEVMRQAIAASRAPVIFSHSSARALDGHPRNVPDDVLASLKAKDGVVMINLYPAFVSDAYRQWSAAKEAETTRQAKLFPGDPAAAAAALTAWLAANPEPAVTVAQVADHVEHVAQIAGHDHVGLGGDYDGIDGAGPAGMKGVDGWPKLFAELIRRGWSDGDLEKLSGGNILRVMDKVDAVTAVMRDIPAGENEAAR